MLFTQLLFLFFINWTPMLLNLFLFFYTYFKQLPKTQLVSLTKVLLIIYITHFQVYYIYFGENVGQQYFLFEFSHKIIHGLRFDSVFFVSDNALMNGFSLIFRTNYWIWFFLLEFLYCFEFVMLIKNPLASSSNSKRKYFYYAFTFFLILLVGFQCYYQTVSVLNYAVNIFMYVFWVAYSLFGVLSVILLVILSKMINKVNNNMTIAFKHGMYLFMLHIYVMINKIDYFMKGDYKEYFYVLDTVLEIVISITRYFTIITVNMSNKEKGNDEEKNILEEQTKKKKKNKLQFTLQDCSSFMIRRDFSCILECISSIGLNRRDSSLNVKKDDFIPEKKQYDYYFDKEKPVIKYDSEIGNRSCFQLKDSFVNQKLTIIEHYPDVFRSIRSLYGIKQDSLSKSFSLESNIYNLDELSKSEGKSGSLFFFTYDKIFILKTIPEREYNSLTGAFLQYYYEYLKANRVSLLVKIYGLYTINDGLSSFHVMMMENVSPYPQSKILYKFDLKGSMYARNTKQLLHNMKHKSLKDKDFLEIKEKVNENIIDIDSKDESIILDIIHDDVQVLTKGNLMDYSLFIAIVENGEGDIVDKHKNVFYSTDHKIMYCISIIDYLTPYEMRKVLETQFKRLIHFTINVNYFSSVEPIVYQHRFFNFMNEKVFTQGKNTLLN